MFTCVQAINTHVSSIFQHSLPVLSIMWNYHLWKIQWNASWGPNKMADILQMIFWKVETSNKMCYVTGVCSCGFDWQDSISSHDGLVVSGHCLHQCWQVQQYQIWYHKVASMCELKVDPMLHHVSVWKCNIIRRKFQIKAWLWWHLSRLGN